MGTLFLDQVKKQASSFLQEKYKAARLAFTDVSPAELLAEEATNNEPRSPDARKMTQIAEASYVMDDYWRIIDVLHRRFYKIDWKQWRQAYNSLVLLEFLLTHGPVELAEEFEHDIPVIEELGKFNHVDKKGFNWGLSMQKKSEQILKLLKSEAAFKQARLKALKVTKEIQGFGSSSCPSPSSVSSFSSDNQRTSSFGSISTSPAWSDTHDTNKSDHSTPRKGLGQNHVNFFPTINEKDDHKWNCGTVQEISSLVDPVDNLEENDGGFVKSLRLKLEGLSPSKGKNKKIIDRSLSNSGQVEKKFGRQFSNWF